MPLVRFIVTIACIALIEACADPKQHEIRYDNVVRIFMHEPNRYTLFTQEPGAPVLVEHGVSINGRPYSVMSTWGNRTLAHCGGVHLLTNAPPDQLMWAVREQWDDRDCNLTIHLHDAHDVDGGGWNHGKFGRGTTNVVE